MIKMIWAEDKNHLIGNGNKLPWHNKEDLKHFKNTTLNNFIVMGPVTFEGFEGKVLPKRITVIWSEDKYKSKYLSEDIKVLNKKEILELAKTQTVFIVGGKTTYNEFMKYANELIVSKIKDEYKGDIYAPEIPKKGWVKTKIEPLSDKVDVHYYKKIDLHIL